MDMESGDSIQEFVLFHIDGQLVVSKEISSQDSGVHSSQCGRGRGRERSSVREQVPYVGIVELLAFFCGQKMRGVG